IERVNLPSNALRRLPREFSGGQRQRIAIARSLMVDPKLVVCDEPVSALDVSTQDRVMELFEEIQVQTGVAYLFIAHDLALVRHISQRVAVMYRGEVVERGDAEVIGSRPQHPYTKKLLLAAPVPDPRRQRERRELRWAVEDASALAETGVVRTRST
ncbi:ATP-binding cassette domain-containing protein, partial [Nocardioides sp.]|uniref:ATP-binding cassette domain-containing protein n=1 Tax=Nocardioides sp. TaxID=35761 RepID=UPI0039E57FFA